MINKYFFFAFFAFIVINADAQTVVDVNKNELVNQSQFVIISGQPFVNAKFVRLIDGSPYFKDDWMEGNAFAAQRMTYTKGRYKLDLFENEIHFLAANDVEMIATNPYTALTLFDSTNNTTYHFEHASNFGLSDVKKGWYLSLVAGKASLYHFFDKQLSEHKPYGSSTYEQQIITFDQFFILHNNSFVEVRKLKDVPLQLGVKVKELQAFLQSAKGSTADRLTALISYYNSLL